MFDRCKPTSTNPAEQLIELLSYYEGEKLRISINIGNDLHTGFDIPEMGYTATDSIEELSNLIYIDSHTVPNNGQTLNLKRDCILEIEDTFYTEEFMWRKDAFEIKYKDGVTISIDVLD